MRFTHRRWPIDGGLNMGNCMAWLWWGFTAYTSQIAPSSTRSRLYIHSNRQRELATGSLHLDFPISAILGLDLSRPVPAVSQHGNLYGAWQFYPRSRIPHSTRLHISISPYSPYAVRSNPPTVSPCVTSKQLPFSVNHMPASILRSSRFPVILNP
jgi:hypothetical protein